MSRVNFARLRSLTARQIVQALRRDGFEPEERAGGHRRYSHPDGRRVTVSWHHSGQTFSIKTLRSIIEKQARWTWDDLRRLGLA